MKRPENMDAAFDALTEWPSMTPRAVFYAGWEAAILQAATREEPSADAVDALTDEQLGDILREHWYYQGEPSSDDIYAAMRAAIAASAPKGDGND